MTSQTQLQSILDGLDIEYSIYPIGLEAGSVSYNFIPPAMNFINSSDLDGVGVLVADGVAYQMFVPLADVPIDAVLSAYGAPARIVVEFASRVLVYPTEGLAFLISRTDSTIVEFAWISSEVGIALRIYGPSILS